MTPYYKTNSTFTELTNGNIIEILQQRNNPLYKDFTIG